MADPTGNTATVERTAYGTWRVRHNGRLTGYETTNRAYARGVADYLTKIDRGWIAKPDASG